MGALLAVVMDPDAATTTHGRRQYVAFGVLSLAAVGCTGVLSLSQGGARLFEPYFLGVPPLLALAATAVVGAASVAFLRSRFGFEIWTSARGVGVAAALATVFAAWQVCADLFVTRFPRDINVPFPQSLLFYPAIGYTVEVVLHALPLALLLALPGRQAAKANSAIVVGASIVVVSALEPVLVHMRMGAAEYVGAFVFVFTLVELWMFRRYDFVSMSAFRLVYYLWWHVTWGYVRLRWLF